MKTYEVRMYGIIHAETEQEAEQRYLAGDYVLDSHDIVEMEESE